jgi:hypothetical protein
VQAGHPVVVSTVVWDGRLGGGPAPTAVFRTLVRVQELTWLSTSRHISLHQSTPRGNRRVPSNVRICTHAIDGSSPASGAAALVLKTGADLVRGIKPRMKHGLNTDKDNNKKVSDSDPCFIRVSSVAENELGAIGLATKEAIYPTHGPRR